MWEVILLYTLEMSGAERIGPRTTQLGVLWQRGEPYLNLQDSDIMLSQRATHTRRITLSPSKEWKKNFFFSPLCFGHFSHWHFFSPSCANNYDLPLQALFPNVWPQRTVLHHAAHWLLQWAISNQLALTTAVTVPSPEEGTGAVQTPWNKASLPSGHCFHWYVQMGHRAVPLPVSLGLQARTWLPPMQAWLPQKWQLPGHLRLCVLIADISCLWFNLPGARLYGLQLGFLPLPREISAVFQWAHWCSVRWLR